MCLPPAAASFERERERNLLPNTIPSPQKKKEQKKQNPERKKFRIEIFPLQIQQSGNTNHRLKSQEIANKSQNLRSKKQFCCYGKPKSASKTHKAPEEAQKTL